MTEQQIQKKISDHYELNGYFVVKLIKTNKNGIPDLLCTKGGSTIFIEVKRQGKHPTPLQQHRIKELRKVGVEAYAMDGINSIIF